MGILNPRFTETISPRRPVEDFGEETFTDLKSIKAVFSTDSQKRGLVFVPRGSDLQANDVFTRKGREFRVLGYPVGDQEHGFTGSDFGWVSYLIGAAT